jgi:hypothetical protein
VGETETVNAPFCVVVVTVRATVAVDVALPLVPVIVME